MALLPRYNHTQTGYLWIVLFSAVLLFLVYMTIVTGEFAWPELLVAAILAFVLFMISSLTVEIKDGLLEARFGIGVIRKRVRLEEIESYRAVKNHWYYGYGIRLTPHGWLYNISGYDAIEFTLKNAKKFRIGTDDPAGLEMALRLSLNK
jgi:hypothetical protein